MAKLTLISTIYSLEPVIICVTRLSPSKIILLSEEGADDKKKRSEEMIEQTFKNALEVEKKYTAVYDTVRVAKDVAELIEQEHARGNQVIVNVSGGRKPQAFGALFGAYARNAMVQRVVYVTEEDSFMIDFPVLSFNLSETKKLILEEIQKGVSSVTTDSCNCRDFKRDDLQPPSGTQSNGVYSRRRKRVYHNRCRKNCM